MDIGYSDYRIKCRHTVSACKSKPRVVGSISDSPCHAVTISGFFWSAKFFQILNAPSSAKKYIKIVEQLRKFRNSRKTDKDIGKQTSSSKEQRRVMPIQVFHSCNACVPWVPIVEIIKSLSFLPVPKTVRGITILTIQKILTPIGVVATEKNDTQYLLGTNITTDIL